MYHAVDASMIRASVFSLAAPLPPWPSLDNASTDTDQWREWITHLTA